MRRVYMGCLCCDGKNREKKKQIIRALPKGR